MKRLLSRRSFLLQLISVLVAVSLACAQSAGPRATGEARILFVGNSLTHGNDLPRMVSELSASAGLRWEVHSVIIGGASLEDHLAEGTAPEQLADQPWDFVVVQQGPSTLPESRANLRRGAAAFRPLVERAGARMALYMVWPDSTWSADRFVQDFDRVRDSYALAASDVRGQFLPAGEAWRMAWARDPDFKLYGPDSFHPSPEGTYLAALTIVAGLSGHSAVGLTNRITTPDGRLVLSLQPNPAFLLQKAADDAVARYGSYVPPDVP